MVDSIFEAEPEAARQSYCKSLAASIAYLSQHRAEWWGVTLYTNGIRLNAGIVENAGATSRRALVYKQTAPANTTFDRRTYRNAPGRETAAIRLSDLARSLPKLASSHQEALERTASRIPFRNIRSAHSTGVVKWLNQLIAAELPTR